MSIMKNILRIMLLFLLGLAMVAGFSSPVAAEYSETIVHPEYPGFTLTYTISGADITDFQYSEEQREERREDPQPYVVPIVELSGRVREGDTITVELHATTPSDFPPPMDDAPAAVQYSWLAQEDIPENYWDYAEQTIYPYIDGSVEVTLSHEVSGSAEVVFIGHNLAWVPTGIELHGNFEVMPSEGAAPRPDPPEEPVPPADPDEDTTQAVRIWYEGELPAGWVEDHNLATPHGYHFLPKIDPLPELGYVFGHLDYEGGGILISPRLMNKESINQFEDRYIIEDYFGPYQALTTEPVLTTIDPSEKHASYVESVIREGKRYNYSYFIELDQETGLGMRIKVSIVDSGVYSERSERANSPYTLDEYQDMAKDFIPNLRFELIEKGITTEGTTSDPDTIGIWGGISKIPLPENAAQAAAGILIPGLIAIGLDFLGRRSGAAVAEAMGTTYDSGEGWEYREGGSYTFDDGMEYRVVDGEFVPTRELADGERYINPAGDERIWVGGQPWFESDLARQQATNEGYAEDHQRDVEDYWNKRRQEAAAALKHQEIKRQQAEMEAERLERIAEHVRSGNHTLSDSDNASEFVEGLEKASKDLRETGVIDEFDRRIIDRNFERVRPDMDQLQEGNYQELDRAHRSARNWDRATRGAEYIKKGADIAIDIGATAVPGGKYVKTGYNVAQGALDGYEGGLSLDVSKAARGAVQGGLESARDFLQEGKLGKVGKQATKFGLTVAGETVGGEGFVNGIKRGTVDFGTDQAMDGLKSVISEDKYGQFIWSTDKGDPGFVNISLPDTDILATEQYLDALISEAERRAPDALVNNTKVKIIEYGIKNVGNSALGTKT